MRSATIVVGIAIGVADLGLLTAAVRTRSVLGAVAGVVALVWLADLALRGVRGTAELGFVALAGVFVLVGVVLLVIGKVVWRALDDGPDRPTG